MGPRHIFLAGRGESVLPPDDLSGAEVAWYQRQIFLKWDGVHVTYKTTFFSNSPKKIKKTLKLCRHTYTDKQHTHNTAGICAERRLQTLLDIYRYLVSWRWCMGAQIVVGNSGGLVERQRQGSQNYGHEFIGTGTGDVPLPA
eukprot:TRINITY_DN7867_c1_g1_i1.p6 TRINITY_DN7867_c1_g1~~TRINITY_DN7867_c1_g1_i1.p6  ORF type:complete len:142 (-),score=14.55 TRINITY_DN7867_c1_g1_i1:326-751(-)